MKRKLIIPLILLGAFSVMGAQCDTDAATASRNLSQAADNFEIMRNIVFYNTWTDTEVVTVTGLCSIEVQKDKLSVICKDDGEFKKHYMGRSDNMTFFAVQVKSADVSTVHTRIVWKPLSFIPDIELKVDVDELKKDRY